MFNKSYHGHSHYHCPPTISWLHESEHSAYSMCSLLTCYHIMNETDIFLPCGLVYLSNKILQYHLPLWYDERPIVHDESKYIYSHSLNLTFTFIYRRAYAR